MVSGAPTREKRELTCFAKVTVLNALPSRAKQVRDRLQFVWERLIHWPPPPRPARSSIFTPRAVANAANVRAVAIPWEASRTVPSESPDLMARRYFVSPALILAPSMTPASLGSSVVVVTSSYSSLKKRAKQDDGWPPESERSTGPTATSFAVSSASPA